LNKALATEGAYLVRPLLDVLGREDKLGLFTYDDSLHTIVDFDDTHDKWDGALDRFTSPHFSETNFYDAAVQVLDRLRIILAERRWCCSRLASTHSVTGRLTR